MPPTAGREIKTMGTHTWTTTAIAAAAALALGSCKHDGATATGAGSHPPPVTSPAIGELLAAVPGNAVALGFIDVDDSPWSVVTGGPWFPLDEATRATLDKELRAYVDRYLGLDVSRLQYAVGFLSGPPVRVAVLMKTVGGTLKLPGAQPYEGGTIWAVDPARGLSLATRGGIISFGTTDAVRDVLDTQAGKRTSVTADNKGLVELLGKESAGAALAFAAIKPAGVPLPRPIGGLARAAAAVGVAGVRAMVEGDDATISGLQQLADRALGEMIGQADRAHDAAVAGTLGPPEGAIAIISAAYARSYAAKLKPTRSGNRLAVSLELGLGGMRGPAALAMVGILSAVAIPAFMDYMKRSKRTEANLQLNKLGKNLKRAYIENAMFPIGTAPLTPAQPCCGQPNNRCRAVPEQYAASPVWRALDFEIDEPTLFQYSYTSSADGQHFTAKAVGDLACNGRIITYVLEGSVVQGNPTITLTEPPLNGD
jgi:Tfp pilus assembly protein PilE